MIWDDSMDPAPKGIGFCVRCKDREIRQGAVFGMCSQCVALLAAEGRKGLQAAIRVTEAQAIGLRDAPGPFLRRSTDRMTREEARRIAQQREADRCVAEKIDLRRVSSAEKIDRRRVSSNEEEAEEAPERRGVFGSQARLISLWAAIGAMILVGLRIAFFLARWAWRGHP